MDGTRDITISFEKFIKRSWPMLVLGAVLLLITSGLLFWFALSGKTRTGTVSAASTDAAAIEVVQATSTDLVSRALDGVLVPLEQAQLQPFAVMVENHTDARPLSGPAAANIVYEFPVEGGITRYMLVFDASTTVDQIGPVRSARPYFVDMADGLNAVYAHVGGAPEALDKIKTIAGFRNLDEFFNGSSFWRSSKRVAPHNVYTRTDLLLAADAAKNWPVGHFRGWHYKDDSPLEMTTTSTARGTTDGPNLYYGGSYSASWAYDRAKNVYLRSEGGETQNDLDGTQVMAKNVIVMRTDGSVFDSYGRLHIRTTGKGKALLFRDGTRSEITWSRADGGHLQFNGIDGTDVYFDRGTTWIEVVIDQAEFIAAATGQSLNAAAASIAPTKTASSSASTGSN